MFRKIYLISYFLLLVSMSVANAVAVNDTIGGSAPVTLVQRLTRAMPRRATPTVYKLGMKWASALQALMVQLKLITYLMPVAVL